MAQRLINRSIGSEIKSQTLLLATKVSGIIFLVAFIFLFGFQVKQRQYAIAKKFEIDKDFLLTSLTIGDLFFITQHTDAFVKSGVVDFIGIRKNGAGEWLASAPRSWERKSLPQAGFKLGAKGIEDDGSLLLSSDGSVVWEVTYFYRISYFVFFWPLVLALGTALIIYFMTRQLLRSTAKRISSPIEALSRDLERQKQLNPVHMQLQEYELGLRFSETESFVRVLQDLIAEISIQNERIKQIEIFKALNKVSRQVNHDIRSPLGALKVAVKRLSSQQGPEITLIEKAVRRIEGIAADLEQPNLLTKAGMFIQSVEVDLRPLLEDLVQEKTIEFKYKQVDIGMDFKLKNLMWTIDPTAFSRAVSNIINNGIEAADGNRAMIKVILAEEQDARYVEIQDNGKGIPKELEAKVFEYGFTSGKPNGSGLGLYHARKVFADSGAQLIYKRLTVGSGFRISFPRQDGSKS